jgi:hypothetical protein
MSLEQAILEAVRALLADKQQEILNHATRLGAESTKKKQLNSIEGIWADLGISLSAEEIDENRREMWRNFRDKTFDGPCCGGYPCHRLVSSP